jgi:hypothetical protein
MRMILLEFNELSPVLMEKFINAGKLPNFKRLRDGSHAFVTEADAPAPDLEPWIQWVSVHSGIPYSEHQIHHLGDGHEFDRKLIWDLLSDEGKSVWVCGSMNINYQTPINGWVLPDPWVKRLDPTPADVLDPYYKFVSANVQEHTSGNVDLTRADQIAFLRFMVRNGLRPATVGAIVKQLAGERRADVGWKRAVILDRLQSDLFESHFKRARPDFSTLFLNSTAHYQHLYWRNMEPEHFKVKPDPGEQEVYQEAILFGYQQMDQLVGRLLKLAGEDTVLVLVTALSQQPSLKYEDIGGKNLYRPSNFQRLIEEAGITDPVEVTPVMAEEFNVDFESEEAAIAGKAKLEALRVGDQPAMAAKLERKGLRCQCLIWTPLEPDARLTVDGDGRGVPFFDIFYRLDLLKSGQHHPDGLLWFHDPRGGSSRNEGRVQLTAIVPTILEMFGAPVADDLPGDPLPVG